MPKVTAIVPNYNHAAFLPQRIATVVGQTFSDVERVFLDDASPDDSLAVFNALAAGRFAVIANERNSGSTFKQWNRGAAAATGEYLWFAESDDFAAPNLLETLVDRLDRNPSCGIASCVSYNVNVRGEVVGTNAAWLGETDPSLWKSDFTMSGRELCAGPLLFRCVIPNASGVVIRRSAYAAAGGADESMRLAGDWMTYARILQHSDFAFVAQPLNYCRMHRGTVRARSRRDGLEVEESYRVFNYIRANVPLSAEAEKKRAAQLLDHWSETVAHRLLPPARMRSIYRAARPTIGFAGARCFGKTSAKLVRRAGTALRTFFS